MSLKMIVAGNGSLPEPDLLDELHALQDRMATVVSGAAALLEPIDPGFAESARNLLAYLVLREQDRNRMQQQLARMGLSSLGRSEACVRHSVDQVAALVRQARCMDRGIDAADPLDMATAERLHQRHAKALFGRDSDGRDVRIMVTLPERAAEDADWVRDLIAAGMDCARINCAHDDPQVWLRMVEHVRLAEAELGTECRIMMDLAGPKLRTGPVARGAAVVRVSPLRDEYGRVIRPAAVWLYPQSRAIPPDMPEVACCLPVEDQWLETLSAGDVVVFKDARDAKRRFEVQAVSCDGCRVTLDKSAYLTPGLVLYRSMDDAKGRSRSLIGHFPGAPGAIRLQVGDRLILKRNAEIGRNAMHDPQGRVVTPAVISCSLPEAFDSVSYGDPVWFDDGMIGGVIESCEGEEMRVRITEVVGKGLLRADKGINFPQSQLPVAALTRRDLESLDFAARHADVVELSFVNQTQDIEALYQALRERQALHLGVVLKIETRQAVDALPELLLAGMAWPCLGVMIARGDLAVETGFECLAEIQEEILCLCEAAHVPVIWATQVLETLARKGQASRAEITDAAASVRADCVMLNKGPYIFKAVHMLDDVLQRMQIHHQKKRDLLRPLQRVRLPDGYGY